VLLPTTPTPKGGVVVRTRLSTALIASVLLVGCSGGDATSPSPTPSASATVSAAAGGLPFPPVGEPVDDAVAAALQTEVDRWVSEGYLTGLTVALVSRGRTWSGAAGADRTGAALTPQTGLTIGSITKTFVAAEVMTLVEEGLVELDAPASTYVDSPLLGKGVTVRHLLEMRSGLHQPVEPPALISRTTTAWTVAQSLATVPNTPRPPGAEFDYNNANYWLLGRIVEQVRKTSLGNAMESDLFEPAGLERITLQSEKALAPPLARPGDDEQSNIPIPAQGDGYLPFRSLATYAGAAAAIASDAPTTARWGYQLYGGQLLEEESVEEMVEFGDDHYGLGTVDFSDLRWNIDALGHEGVQVGFRSVLAVFPESQLAVVILSPSTVNVGALVQYLVKAGDLTGP
jgi:D-alanyl-D-alanine carboxypeptidase